MFAVSHPRGRDDALGDLRERAHVGGVRRVAPEHREQHVGVSALDHRPHERAELRVAAPADGDAEAVRRVFGEMSGHERAGEPDGAPYHHVERLGRVGVVDQGREGRWRRRERGPGARTHRAPAKTTKLPR